MRTKMYSEHVVWERRHSAGQVPVELLNGDIITVSIGKRFSGSKISVQVLIFSISHHYFLPHVSVNIRHNYPFGVNLFLLLLLPNI